jgi:hypothetical protein
VGLTVCVGLLVELRQTDEEAAASLREQLSALNDVLREHGLAEHHEPEGADWDPLSFDLYGYSGLHYLRRVAAHLDRDGVLPEPGRENASDDPVLAETYELAEGKSVGLLGRLRHKSTELPATGGFDHLVHHSDAEGFYVPQAFRRVLRAPGVVGELVGSSVILRDELERLGRALELPDALDPEDEALWHAAESQGEGETTWERYGVESFTCARLHAAAEASIEHHAAIVFA